MPYVDQWEKEGDLPEQLFKKAADAGLFQIGNLESYGPAMDYADCWWIDREYQKVSDIRREHGSLRFIAKLESLEKKMITRLSDYLPIWRIIISPKNISIKISIKIR